MRRTLRSAALLGRSPEAAFPDHVDFDPDSAIVLMRTASRRRSAVIHGSWLQLGQCWFPCRPASPPHAPAIPPAAPTHFATISSQPRPSSSAASDFNRFKSACPIAPVGCRVLLDSMQTSGLAHRDWGSVTPSPSHTARNKCGLLPAPSSPEIVTTAGRGKCRTESRVPQAFEGFTVRSTRGASRPR
jgi:hypothetical protein